MEGTKDLFYKKFKVTFLPPALAARNVLLGVLTGLLTGHWLKPSMVWLLVLLLVLLISRLLSRQITKLWCYCLGFSLAILRLLWLANTAIAVPLAVPVTTVTGTVVAQPVIVDKMIKYSLQSDQGFAVVIFTRPYPAWSWGDQLLISCTKPEIKNSIFNLTDSVWQCWWPQVSLLRSGSGWRRWLVDWRQRLAIDLGKALPEPYAALTAGMLWGDTSALSWDISDNFKKTGTTHLLAVSGYNVMVLTVVVLTLLIGFGFYQRSANIVTVFLITVFVLFTGAQAATVRAGIMGSLVLLARCLKRQPDRLNLLLLAAAAMLFVSPVLLTDLGWQLSFAAMAGLMFVSPLWQERLKFIPQRLGLRSAAAETLAANLTTLPIILGRLDQLYLISPLANLLIGPAVQLVFILGLPILPLVYLSDWLWQPLAWLLRLVLSYIILLTKLLAHLPGFSLHNISLTWWLVVLLYAFLIRWLVLLGKRKIYE